jgi:hypothetical protein
MGLFFFRKEIEREQFAQRLDSLESQITMLNARIDGIINVIGMEVAKQIQSAKAVEKAHETNPSLAKRMQAKRIRRVGTYAERQYNEPFQIAWVMKNNGYTRAQIANVLNAKGFKTPQSNEFSKAAVTDLMHNLHQKKQMEYKQTKITNLNVTSMPKSVDFLDGIQ